MRSSTIPERSGPALRSTVPQDPAQEQSSSMVMVYPGLETIEPVSHDQSRVLPASSGSGGFNTAPAHRSDGQSQRSDFQRHTPSTTTSTPVQHVTGPSIITPHGLPTYRQISMSGDGSHPSSHPSSGSESLSYQLESSLPDILNSHIVPHIPPARPNQHRQHRNLNRRSNDEGLSRGNRHQPRPHGERSGRTRRASARTQSTSSSQTQENSCKEPCVKCVVTVTSFRWVLVVLSVLGVSCVVAGIILAALHPAVGTSLLYLSVMFIGLGVLLVVVVGVGWRCTPRGHEPLHALFGIGSFRHRRSRDGRNGRYRNRDRNWFGGMLYPEFQYRRPPPSYTASMQDYQNQVSHEQDDISGPRNTVQGDGDSLPNSPPPSYRSRASTAHSGIHIAFPHSLDGDHPSSRPPTYRSRAPSRRPSLPHENETGQTVLEIDAEGLTTYDVSMFESSHVHATHDGAQTNRIITSASTSSSYPQSSRCTANDVSSETSYSKQQTTMSIIPQVYTVPLRRSSQNDIQNSLSQTVSAHNLISNSSPSSSCQQNVTAGSQNGQKPLVLHQRMASEDRHILEQTLQSLEEHMNESAGITNDGANFEEQDQTTHHLNTYM